MHTQPATGRGRGLTVKRVGQFAALAALLAIVLMPTPLGQPLSGQVMLGILAFIRTGLVITLAATVLLVIFALTYWSWKGCMTRAA